MFDRLANSLSLARSSWQVLRQEKQLVIFPILSGLGCLLVLASFAVPFILHPQWLGFLAEQPARGDFAQDGQFPAWTWALLFAYYFCSYFVIVFCNAALISCALIRFHGDTPTVADGFQAAVSRLPQILAWSLVSATVGVLLKVVENVHEKAGAFISSLLGSAWTVLTFFVVPVLVVEKVGPFQAIQRSLALLRRAWGEALVGHMGVGLILFLFSLLGIGLFVVGGFLCQSIPVLGVALLAAAVVYLLVLAAAGSALNGIFLAALYQYAAFNQVPGGFEQGILERAFARK